MVPSPYLEPRSLWKNPPGKIPVKQGSLQKLRSPGGNEARMIAGFAQILKLFDSKTRRESQVHDAFGFQLFIRCYFADTQ
jgi:hypothetical protein